MERHDEKPRARPDREAGRSDEAAPEEGPAAADAAREYTDTGGQRTGHDYVDPSGEYSEAGRDESVESVPTSQTESGRQAAADEAAEERRAYAGPDTATATAAPGTYPGETESPAGAAIERQAVAGSAGDAVGTARPEGEAAYDAAAERKAVTPPDAEPRPAEATTAPEQAGSEPSAAGAQTTPGAVTLVEQTAVLSREDAQTFQVRWETIQGTFIDDPHAATEQADALVGEVMEQLARLREDYLRQLRGALGDGSDTEAMRVALQRYRAFFQMLLG